jgi:hypothetical protein
VDVSPVFEFVSGSYRELKRTNGEVVNEHDLGSENILLIRQKKKLQ